MQELQELIEHGKRVGNIAFQISKCINLNEKEAALIKRAGELHDIGKISIPKTIVNKPGILNKLEYEIMRQHVIYSYLILKYIGMNEDICQIIRHHHESFDGSGYPDGLKEKEIPLGARILKVADVFDALINKRVYKNQIDINETLNIMKQDHRQYDPEILSIFFKFCKLINIR